MAKPTARQVAFLQSHGLEPVRSIWNCKPSKWFCHYLILYLKRGNGATNTPDTETLEDRVALYEAALLEFAHMIVVPRVLRLRGILIDETNGPLEVLGIDPKPPGYVARQKAEGLTISPFYVTIVPANTLIKGGNVYGGDLEDYCVVPAGQGYWVERFGQRRVYLSSRKLQPINFFRMLELKAGVL